MEVEENKMALSKRTLLMLVSVVLAISMSVFGTIAYLTSSAQATNTFTVGDVEITLDETEVDEDGNPKYPVDTDGDGETDVEISIDDNGTITVDPTPDDDSDEPIVIKPDEDSNYPPTDIDGDGDKDEIEVDDNGNIIVKPEGGDPTTIVPGVDVTIDDDGTITIDPDCPECEDIVIKPNEDGTYPDTDVDGDGDKDKIEVDEDGNIIITDPDGNTIVTEPSKTDGNEYNVVPGQEYLKDPTVTVKADSEESYVRMRVEITNYAQVKAALGVADDQILSTFAPDLNTADWEQQDVSVADDVLTVEFWYKETVEAGKVDVELPALFETFTVPGTLTKDELMAVAGMEMNVYGDAIQAVTFDTAEEAWAAFGEQEGN